jgi:hypothetical protein
MFLHLCIFKQPVYDKCAEQFADANCQETQKNYYAV